MKGHVLGLLELLGAPPEPAKRIDAILATLTLEEQAALRTALGSPQWTHQALADVLSDSGHPISEASIRRYRKASK